MARAHTISHPPEGIYPTGLSAACGFFRRLNRNAAARRAPCRSVPNNNDFVASASLSLRRTFVLIPTSHVIILYVKSHTYY